MYNKEELKVKYQKYIDAGFNINGLLSAGVHMQNSIFLDAFESEKDLEQKESMLESDRKDPIEALKMIDMSTFKNPADGIDYIFPERESWMSPLSILVDFILVNILISQFDQLKKSTSEMQEALKIKSKIKASLLSNDVKYYAAFLVLFSNKKLCKTIVQVAYSEIEDMDEILFDHEERMSSITVNTIVSDNKVKTELRAIASLFRENSKNIGSSLKAIEEHSDLEWSR